MYLLPLISEVVQKVTVRDELRDETQRFLDGDTTHQVHNVVVVAFRYLLHHLNLRKEVRPLLPSRRIYFIYNNEKEYHHDIIIQ